MITSDIRIQGVLFQRLCSYLKLGEQHIGVRRQRQHILAHFQEVVFLWFREASRDCISIMMIGNTKSKLQIIEMFFSKQIIPFFLLLHKQLHNILDFASWPEEPKIFTIQPYTEKCCQPLFQNNHKWVTKKCIALRLAKSNLKEVKERIKQE